MVRGGQRRTMSLLVRNIKYQTSPDRLREIFEKFGSIRDVYLPLDYHTKRPRGFGFVEYYDEKDAENALKEMDNQEIDGNRIEVTMAQRGRSEPDEMRHREHKHVRPGDRSFHHRRASPPYDRRVAYQRSMSPRGRRRRRRSPSISPLSDCSRSRRRVYSHRMYRGGGGSGSSGSRERYDGRRSPRDGRYARRMSNPSQESRRYSVGSSYSRGSMRNVDLRRVR